MTTRELLDARLEDFDRRCAAAVAIFDHLTAKWADHEPVAILARPLGHRCVFDRSTRIR